MLPLRPFLILITALSVTPALADGQTTLVRRFSEESGLVPPVWAIGQDADGFLWVGAEGGLYRYDGTTLSATAGIRNAILSLDFHADGRVAAVSDRGEILEVRRGTVHRLEPPGPPGPRRIRMIAYDGEGGLWTIRGQTLFRRAANGRWHGLDAGVLAEEQPLLVRPGTGGGVLVATERAVWHVRADAPPRKVVDAHNAVDVLAVEDRVLALRSSGHLMDGAHAFWIPGEATELAGARSVALAQRGETTWVAFDRFLVAVRPEQPLEILSSRDGIEAGGPLFVDREGSLWMGSYTALLQFPEPETRVWTERQGLPSGHVRFLARTGRTMWVTGWQGVARIDTGESASRASAVTDWFSQQRLCADRTGSAVWASSDGGYVELEGSGVARVHPLPGRVLGCAWSGSGGVWIASTTGVLRALPGEVPEIVPTPPPGGTESAWEAVLEDRRGGLWLARDGRVCTNAVRPSGDWRCRAVAQSGTVTGMVELPSGAIWLSTLQAGVLRLDDTLELKAIRASRELPTSAIMGLVPSPSGGVWVLGHGILQRVTETPGGWEVVERLGQWHGLPVTGGQDLVEDEDGTVWITTSLGVVQVRSAARYATAQPPPVSLVEASVDGEHLPPTRELDLPYQRNRLELRFAALSFRDPALVRYQIRLPEHEPWREVTGNPWFRWFDLGPGRYTAQFRASLDGQRWSPIPAGVQFRVRPPWYQKPWVIALFAGALGLAALFIHRARVRMLLGLERQRMRIAMDLHDEVGSGLGSIGILAGVLADSTARPANAPAERTRRLAGQIARSSEQLGEALSDIVWSLDPGSASLHELAARLAEHGEHLCASDDGPEFVAELPTEWPRQEVAPRIRRNVLSIGLEALHNAARHAHAHRLVLRLRPLGASWELSIRDDGRGLGTSDRPVELDANRSANGGRPGTGISTNRGRGLPGMQRRAREIAADLTVDHGDAGGTIVRLRFPLA